MMTLRRAKGRAALEALAMCDEWDIPLYDEEYCPKCGAAMVRVTEHYEVWGSQQWHDYYYCPICNEGEY